MKKHVGKYFYDMEDEIIVFAKRYCEEMGLVLMEVDHNNVPYDCEESSRWDTPFNERQLFMVYKNVNFMNTPLYKKLEGLE